MASSDDSIVSVLVLCGLHYSQVFNFFKRNSVFSFYVFSNSSSVTCLGSNSNSIREIAILFITDFSSPFVLVTIEKKFRGCLWSGRLISHLSQECSTSGKSCSVIGFPSGKGAATLRAQNCFVITRCPFTRHRSIASLVTNNANFSFFFVCLNECAVESVICFLLVD